MRELVLGLAAAAAVNAAGLRLPPQSARTLPVGLSVHSAVETAGLLSFGMRRLAADLGLVRLLIYYGTVENAQDDGHGHGDHAHGEIFGGGHYPEIGPRAAEILKIDPEFSYPVLYASGALAFNLERPQEALDLLAQAMKSAPSNYDYKAYTAAIGFHRQGDMTRVMELLEPTLADPQAPTMVKNMMAFMYRRAGRKAEAVRLYKDIAENSRDEGYRTSARRNLRELVGH